jgi:hypothetical protein
MSGNLRVLLVGGPIALLGFDWTYKKLPQQPVVA